jgi:hypothetical protein
VTPEILARLAGCRIELVAEARGISVFARQECLALVQGDSIGSSGIMTESGLAYLVWRDGRAWLVSKGSEVAAAPAEVETIRRFSEDLKRALEPAAP